MGEVPLYGGLQRSEGRSPKAGPPRDSFLTKRGLGRERLCPSANPKCMDVHKGIK
jgi:hypothetical protein